MMFQAMAFRSVSLRPLPAALLAALACGRGSEAEVHAPAGPAEIRTLAYVLTECREDAQQAFYSQSLRIQQGDRPPVGACRRYGQVRVGSRLLLPQMLTGCTRTVNTSALRSNPTAP